MAAYAILKSCFGMPDTPKQTKYLKQRLQRF